MTNVDVLGQPNFLWGGRPQISDGIWVTIEHFALSLMTIDWATSEIRRRKKGKRKKKKKERGSKRQQQSTMAGLASIAAGRM